MTEPEWSRRARDRIAGRTLVVVGIGTEQLLGFGSAGAHVAGAVSVVPAGSPAPRPDGRPDERSGAPPLPVLTVTGAHRDILDHVVAGYARALEDAGREVRAFLGAIDPRCDATVVSYLPLPHTVVDGRDCWTADSAVAAALEDKDHASTVLAGAVSTIPSEPMPPGPPDGWFDVTRARLGASRLVIQAGGLSGGGTGTWVCATAEEVPTVVGNVLPFVEGMAGNVMGVVDGAGDTAVLPASRQIVRLDPSGRPLYAGNVTGEPWASAHRMGIERDVRRLGDELADRGFFGPFGVDFILTPEGDVRYHDLNPRMNGVADSLGRLLVDPALVPIVPLLLSATPWAPAEIASLEAFAHATLASQPMARLWLTTVVERPMRIDQPPAAGSWRIDATARRAVFVGGDRVSGQDAVLQPLVPPGAELVPGDRLALGNLYCDPELARALGDDCGPALIDAFLA